MPDTPAGRKPPADRVLNVTVRRIIPTGLIVGLPDGREGLIRERELAWDETARKGWRKRYKPGESLEAVLLDTEQDRQQELSLRLVQDDPWLDIEQRYQAGKLLDGVITGIMPYGVFVELEQGVTGLVHTSRFPTWVKGEPSAVFWPDDWVKVIIDEVDIVRRQMTLSLADPARLRWRQMTQVNSPRPTQRKTNDTPAISARVTQTGRLLPHSARSILVADDSAVTRAKIGDWLRHAGHQVIFAEDGPTALAVLRKAPPEIVLLDVHLPGMPGTQIAQVIQHDWPEVRCILMSGDYEPNIDQDELAALLGDGIPFLNKPFRPEDLLQHLFDRAPTPEPSATIARTLQARTSQRTHSQPRSQLTEVVDLLWRTTRVNLVVLFELDPVHRTVRIVEQRGRPAIQAAALPVLIHSPVRDVAEDGLLMRAANADEASRPRFRHLAALHRFASCLGLPVSVTLPNRYALFLFSDQPNLAVNASVEEFASASAVAAAAWLERDAFAQQTAELQRLVLLGQLGRTLVHEINNQVQNIPWAATKLPSYLEQLNKLAGADLAQAQVILTEAKQFLQEVSLEVNRLASIARPFTGLARLDHQESLLLDRIIEEAVSVVQDTAQRANVALSVESLVPFAYMRGQDTALHQILVNLLLNAVQQIELTRGRSGGRVAIRLTAGQRDDRPVYWISIEDDGPGIHNRLWDERIFEMGYSTRPGGSGVGLSVARNLIEGMEGQISVAESWLIWGSTFVIELPK